MNLTRITDAESEAISLTDARNHLHISDTDNDDSLRLFIAAIRHKVENYLGKTLITSTWELKLDAFSETVLPMSPLASIESVSYIDTNGDTQTFTDYQFDKQGRFKPSYGNSFPSTRDQMDAVTITYKAGETHAGKVPEDIKLAMLLYIGSCDLNRENIAFTQVTEIPDSAKDLLSPHRAWRL